MVMMRMRVSCGSKVPLIMRDLLQKQPYTDLNPISALLRARIFINQQTEIAIKVKALNKISALGTFPLNRAASLSTS